MESAEEKFKNLYNDLFSDIEKYKKDCLSTLVPMMGKQYKSEKIKLMIVGRATNGWGEPDYDSKYPDNSGDSSQYTNVACKKLSDTTRFGWIKKAQENNENPYNAETKPFWNYAREVLNKLREILYPDTKWEHDTKWYQSIVWSNLFPVSFSDEGNPSESLKCIQFDSARELLKEQIKYFQPTHVLIMTDWDGWFFMSKKKGEDGEKFLPTIEKINNNEIVKGSGIFDNSRVVVSRRPEFCNKEKFVNAVVDAFKSI